MLVSVLHQIYFLGCFPDMYLGFQTWYFEAYCVVLHSLHEAPFLGVYSIDRAVFALVYTEALLCVGGVGVWSVASDFLSELAP